MKPLLAFGLMLLVLLTGCQAKGTASAAGEFDRTATPTSKGTLALINLQRPSGGFSYTSGEDHVGITAIAGLAMLSASDIRIKQADRIGLLPSELAPPVNAAAEFILRNQQKNGYLHREGDAAGMYGHAFALLFLTQLHATTTDSTLKPTLAEAIKAAVQLTESGQNAQGGWRYEPTPKDADVSVTAAQVKSLAAAKQQGFQVNDKTIARGVAYLKSAQQPDGGFAYTLGGGGSAWPRSAAATAALLYAGAGDTRKAISYLEKAGTTGQGAFYYGAYYLVQVLKLGEPEKTKSAAALRTALLERQDRKTGLWSGEVGEAYATSMALIVLYTPTTNLPAFQRQ